MSLKNLSVAIKIPKKYKDKLSNRRINQIFKRFENSFNPSNNFIVAVSGGPDSMALAFLTKLYSIKHNLNPKYYIVDHKLREESTTEAIKVRKILKIFKINSQILTCKGKKPTNNIQSMARKNRYDLLFSKCKKLKIVNLVLGHHLDDMVENFFLRMIRGSGLRGLVSLEENTLINNINLLRPLLGFNKKDLIFISKNVFNFYVLDPTNYDVKFNRIKIRNFIKELQSNGLDDKKFLLTIDNLKRSNRSLKYYVEENKNKNSFLNLKKNELIIKKEFFNNSYEVIFRSMSDQIKLVGMKYNFVRGKKIDNIIHKIKNNTLIKETLGGCVIKKVNQTVILTKEHQI